MFGSNILDVAIGMAGVYLLLSFITTAANELIAAFLLSRGKYLRRGIATLLPEHTARSVYAHPLVQGLSRSGLPSYIPSRTFALALLDVISGDSGVLADVATLPGAIDQLPAPLKQPLKVLLGEANGDVEKFKTNVEVWFNNSMDRVSGWYKRKTQFVLSGLAIVVAVAFNIDSVLLANQLSQDASLRTALVARAEAAGKKSVVATTDTSSDPGITKAEADLSAATDNLRELELPIGWVTAGDYQSTSPAARPEKQPRLLPTTCFSGSGSALSIIGKHLGGWVLTALAISLGAPFWFDLLNKLINIRSAGNAPEEKPKEPKEVPQPLGPGQSPLAK